MLAQTYRGVCHTRDFRRTLRKHSCGDGNLSDDFGRVTTIRLLAMRETLWLICSTLLV